MRVPFLYCRGAIAALALFASLARAQTNLPVPAQDTPDNAPGTALLSQPSSVRIVGGGAGDEAPQISRDRTDADIADVTARLVQEWQFSQHPFDAEISSKFLDRYLESLDYYHMLFLQSDLHEFEAYRTNLQDYVLKAHDISPAYVIFSRFLQRARERENFETNLVQTGKFDFSGHERFTPDRHDLPNPKDVQEATNLWREEVRYDYLDEKLREKIVFNGPVTFDGESNLLVTFTRKDTNSSSLDFLPAKFLDQQGRETGWLEASGSADKPVQAPADATNAILHLVHVDIPAGDNLVKFTNNFFSADGTLLGSITFERAPEAMDATNNTALGRSSEADSGTTQSTNSTTADEARTIPVLPAPAPAKKFICQIQLNQKDTAKIARSLQKRYVQILKNYDDLTNDGHVLEYYLTSLARAYDPHSDYFGRAQAENFDIQMNLSLVGIGAVLHKTDSDMCEIEELIPDGPAAKSGKITNNDIIVAVAQKDQEAVPVNGMPLQEVVDMIRGPKDTPVTLTIEQAHPHDPSARQKLVTLIRAKVKLVDKEAKADLFETAPKIGVINVPSFYAETDADGPDPLAAHERKSVTSDVAKLVTRLKKENVDGIILDFRANGGGYLDQAIKLTGLFVGKGPVVQTKSPDGEITADSSDDPAPLYDGPLIVLTSRLSASASEILAGALQDYGRALIVGDKTTFGKGTVQTVQPLEPFMRQDGFSLSTNLGRLHVTIKKFYRASGLTTESNGVAADIVLPSILNYANFSESSQPNWLPADTVTSADVPQRFNMVKPYLADLLQRSVQRREKSKDFTWLQEDIDEYRKSLDDKTLSMNEAERLAKQQTDEARMEARKKDRTSRPKSDEKVFDITVKNAADDAPLETAAAKPKPAPDDDADPAETEDTPEDPILGDVILTETRNIMADYIALLKKPLAAADKSP